MSNEFLENIWYSIYDLIRVIQQTTRLHNIHLRASWPFAYYTTIFSFMAFFHAQVGGYKPLLSPGGNASPGPVVSG